MSHSQHRYSSLFAIAVIAALFSGQSSASETCQLTAKYLWTFQPGVTRPEETAWNALSERSKKLNGAKRLAAPGVAEKIFAYPFPSVPAKLMTKMEKETLSKIKRLYYRYVLLSRTIEDSWNDEYADDSSASSMQKFMVERKTAILEMNQVARAAKDELVHYAFRSQNCFNEYEDLVGSKALKNTGSEVPIAPSTAVGATDSYGTTSSIDLDDVRAPASSDHPTSSPKR